MQDALTDFGIGASSYKTGDFNGDGRADLVAFMGSSSTGDQEGDVLVSLAMANGVYGVPTRWHDWFISGTVHDVGDFDGDGCDDIVAFVQQSGSADIALSNCTNGFAPIEQWTNFISPEGETPRVADFNGDGKDDLVTFVHFSNLGHVWVSLSCGLNAQSLPEGCERARSFGSRLWWLEPNGAFSLATDSADVGDFNGDGLADLVTFEPSGDVYVGLTERRRCGQSSDCPFGPCWQTQAVCAAGYGEGRAVKRAWLRDFSREGSLRLTGDVNGDGMDDVITFRAEASTFVGPFVALSTGQSFSPSIEWGAQVLSEGALVTMGDANADGLDDFFAVQRDLGPGEVRLGISQ